MKRYAALIILTLLAFTAHTQQTKQIQIAAEFLEYDKSQGKEMQKLIENVKFTHEGAVMYCDSAYWYSKQNSLDAFSNVHLIQGDTLHIYSDFLKYDGNTRIANLRDNVKMVDDSTILYTDFFDYDRNDQLGYYYNGGRIESGENILISDWGYYYSETKDFYFKRNVEVENPDYNMFSDTLRYNSRTEIAYFLGPTEIISENELVFGESGWYNTITDKGQISTNTYLTNYEQTMHCDSMFIDRETGFAEAFRNMQIIDTINNVQLHGDYGIFWEELGNAFVTDSAEMWYISATDTMFLHGDTLRMITVNDSVKTFHAYNRVKAFKPDVQIKCDSLIYHTYDSTSTLFGDPVIWSEGNQITGSKITIFQEGNELRRVEIDEPAFIASQFDPNRYNQIKGREMIGFFKDGYLNRIFVDGNGETIYFPDDQGQVIGVNIAVSAQIEIMVNRQGQVTRIKTVSSPEGKLHPERKVSSGEKILKGFNWLETSRPKKREDIFIWNN